MDDESLARQAADLTWTGWNRVVREANPLGGGMNSATALVQLDDGPAVLKWVPRGVAADLLAGCEVARRLARHGLVTGEPIPTVAGDLILRTDAGAVALLAFVEGQPLDPDSPHDQRAMAATLAAVHAAEATHQSGPFMGDQILDLTHDIEPWVRPSVDQVLAEYRRLPELTWGLLHGDPEAGAFRRRPGSETVALIDWSASARGPVLYDVASALMYLGGREQAEAFWAAYLRHSPARPEELEEHVPAFTRYRAAVQAAYFSMRIATDDRTGIDDDHENWKGLRDAELMLRASGVNP
jgi:homoserine kinase type II